MSTTKFAVAEETIVVETAEKEQFELSLLELDMVAGGTAISTNL